jgi:hypothetical protein
MADGGNGHDGLLQFFSDEDLSPDLVETTRPIDRLARHLFNTLPHNTERTVTMRKLLEARDCAIRARSWVLSSEDSKHRSHLPIPTPQRTGLITFDAKDPDTKFPPIEHLRPPPGCTQRAAHPHRRRRVRFFERVWRPLPDAERGKARSERSEVQLLPHYRSLLSDTAGSPDGAQSPLRGHGRHYRDRHRSPGLLLGAA